MAPQGASRRTLAEALAAACGGTVTPFFHPQSEVSLVPGAPVFDNLTLGFEVRDAAGALHARCVDDLTLQHDLQREHAPRLGWFRVVSDDLRLLHLVARTGRADAGPLQALEAVAALFGSAPELLGDGMVRVCDEAGAPIAIATPLPGERERPCELITPPIDNDHAERLDALLAPARALGFTLAHESATHVHFDAAPLRSAPVLRKLIRLLRAWGPALRGLVGVNPACRRLGDWPPELYDTVEAADFATLDWPAAQSRLRALGLSKYCDFNLKNLVHDIPGKPTFEVRVLPGLCDTASILAGAALFEAVLRVALEAAVWACDQAPDQAPGPAPIGPLQVLDQLPLTPELQRYWRARVAQSGAHAGLENAVAFVSY
jgi:hypothetical protein